MSKDQNQPAQPVSGAMTDAEFLSKRLARVARLVGVPMPDFSHEGVSEVAGTILGQIASKLESDRIQDAQAIRNAALEDLVIIEAVREVVERDGYDVQDEHQAGLVEAVAVATVRALQSAPAQPVERPDAELPPLPRPKHWWEPTFESGLPSSLACWSHNAEPESPNPAWAVTDYFTGDQMRDYALAAIAANQPQQSSATDEMLDMLGRIHPYAMGSKEDRMDHAEERLRRAYCIQQPAPVPDQACIVWRADLMRVMNDLTHKRAYFDYHTKDANQPQQVRGNAQEPVAVVYPPDGTVSPFTVINLGLGAVQMGDCIHDNRLHALWFGKNGKGMGHEEQLNRAAHEGETLAVVTFSNVEGLDVLMEVLQRVRAKAFPAAAPQVAQESEQTCAHGKRSHDGCGICGFASQQSDAQQSSEKGGE